MQGDVGQVPPKKRKRERKRERERERKKERRKEGKKETGELGNLGSNIIMF